MDSSVDIFIKFETDFWNFTKALHEGEVKKIVFNWLYGTEITISSQEKEDNSIDAVWEVAQQDLEASYSGFKWEKEEQVSVGDYLGRGIIFGTEK